MTRLLSFRRGVAVALAVILPVVGFAIGRSSSQTQTADRVAAAPTLTSAAPDPVAVAVALVRQLNDPTLPADTRDRLLHRVAGSHADALMATFTPGPGFAQATGLSPTAPSAQQFIAAVVPITGHVVSASSGQVRVVVWAVSVVATRRLGQLVESWSTETLDLQRVSSRWLLTGYHSSAGPAPASTQPPAPVDAALTAFGSVAR